MPDERRYLQSKFKKKTCNPKFEESFVFQVRTCRLCVIRSVNSVRKSQKATNNKHWAPFHFLGYINHYITKINTSGVIHL